MSIELTHIPHWLSEDFERKLPNALKNALNDIGFAARADLISHERSELTLTRNFLPSQTKVNKATTTDLKVEIGLDEKVKFGETLQEGGERNSLDSEYVPIPLSGVNNKRPRGGMSVSKILSRANTFIFEDNGEKYIGRSVRGNIQILYILKPSTSYGSAPYLDIEEIIEQAVSRHDFRSMVERNILRALR